MAYQYEYYTPPANQGATKQKNTMKFSTGNYISAFLLAVVFSAALFVWYGCRIEPGNGEIAVLIRKTGKPLAQGEILANDSTCQGIQLNVLGEGRYFRNPYVWDWVIKPITDIPAGHFGVLVRRYGKDLPNGATIAPNDSYKGIVREVLGTGKHRINPYAYDVQVFEDIRIAPGNIGVITNLAGKDLFCGTPNDLSNNGGFIVDGDRKGVLSTVLKEGTHRINPFCQSVAIVNVQSQRYEFSGADAIVFLTSDGFSISLEGTVEFNISAEAAPRLTHEVGDMEDILKKLILPSVSGFARVQGSKKTATEFIVGKSRQLFQNNLEAFLRKACENWGVRINSVLIRDIIPPQDIAQIIRNRELAQQEAKKFKQQIEQAKSAQLLTEQKTLALRSKALVEANTAKKTAEIAATQVQEVALVTARTDLEAADLEFKSTQADSEAKLREAEAQRKVLSARNEAEAEVLRENIGAYGSAQSYADALLYSTLAPKLKNILAPVGTGIFGLPAFEAAGASSATLTKEGN